MSPIRIGIRGNFMRLFNRFMPLVGLLTAFGATPAQATTELTGYSYSPGSKYGGISVQSLGFEHGGYAGRFSVDARDTITFAPSTFYAFCIDVTTDLLTYSPYTVSTIIPGLADANKRAQVAAVLFHSGGVIDALVTEDDRDSASAALQLAVWEILYETGTSGYSIADGNFSVYYDFDPLISLADSYLANVEMGTWTGDAATLRALVTDTGTSQNLVYQTNAVPEPASWALMILGFGIVGAALRRRRDGVALAA
jgi:PEP-CTERM motif/Thioester domain